MTTDFKSTCLTSTLPNGRLIIDASTKELSETVYNKADDAYIAAHLVSKRTGRTGSFFAGGVHIVDHRIRSGRTEFRIVRVSRDSRGFLSHEEEEAEAVASTPWPQAA